MAEPRRRFARTGKRGSECDTASQHQFPFGIGVRRLKGSRTGALSELAETCLPLSPHGTLAPLGRGRNEENTMLVRNPQSQQRVAFQARALLQTVLSLQTGDTTMTADKDLVGRLRAGTDKLAYLDIKPASSLLRPAEHWSQKHEQPKAA